ncbi:MAG: hypothetical protein EBE86_002510 [Hormoscilla sp. GUM202]|nr:hypothetical protein [Hormoscilla sp. GUM202]
MSLSDHSLLYQLMHDHATVNAIILAAGQCEVLWKLLAISGSGNGFGG